jgi:transcriptional regulator with XRE-family HTH domain
MDSLHPETDTVDVGERIVGQRVRELRKAKRMTLKELALASRLSSGYISLIERDLCTPSIKALHDIATALEINISWFFPDPSVEAVGSEAHMIVRAENRRVLRFDNGVRDELLCPNLGGELELLSCYFEPGASSGDSPYAHESEEAGVVIRGQLDLWVDGTLYQLKQGDSFHFDSRKPHRYTNTGETETHVIWAITPPTY